MIFKCLFDTVSTRNLNLMKLTKLSVDKLPLPMSPKEGVTGQKRYYDDSLKGFGVRVTSGGSKSFFIEKRVGTKLRRMTLGHYPALTVEQARNEAQKVLGKIAMGVDPIAEKKEAQVRSVTLEQVFSDYIKARKNLKPRTLQDYHCVLKQAVPDWLDKPLISITKDMITKRHTTYGEKSQARANLVMRLLRAIFNFGAGQYEDAKGKALIAENPVKRLSHTRAWYRVERRQTIIKAHELPVWYHAVAALSDERITGKSDIIRDYLLLLLFTGLRRQEAARLRWSQVDLTARTLTIVDTKNHENHILPLSDFLFELLSNRKQKATSNYVFPGEGKGGYLVEPRKVMAKVINSSGINFSLHDLRRTFITVAESLDIPAYALKRLLNHKMSNDVTAGYIIIDVERLRRPMQQITDYLLKCMNVKETAQIIEISHQIKKLNDVATSLAG